MKTTIILATAGAVFLTGAVASAQKITAAAERHKKKAFELFSAGDYPGGIGEMEQAFKKVPHPNFVFNIAVAYDQWGGHCAESLESFERFFELCKKCKSRKVAKKRFDVVNDKCRPLVKINSTPPGAQITLDGKALGVAPLETRALAGEHVLRAELVGYQTLEQAVRVDEGQQAMLTLGLVPAAVASLPSTPEPPPAPPSSPDATPTPSITTSPKAEGGSNTLAYTCLGVGGVGLVAGGVFTALTLRQVGQEEDARTSVPPEPIAIIEAHRRAAKRNAIIANVGFGLGIVGVATGVVMLLLDDGPGEAGVALLPTVSPGQVGLVGRF